MYKVGVLRCVTVFSFISGKKALSICIDPTCNFIQKLGDNSAALCSEMLIQLSTELPHLLPDTACEAKTTNS